MSVQNKKEKIRLVVLEILMIALTVVIIIPFYYLFVTTLKSPEEATLRPLGFPQHIAFENYIKAWISMDYPHVFLNTLLITVCSVFGVVGVASLAAYAIARCKIKMNKVLYYVFLSGLMIPFATAIVPLYKLISGLGLMNTPWAVVLVEISVGIPFSIFMFRSFIVTISIELEEAAFIDGCNVFRTFLYITFPLLKPVIATVLILETLNVWNDFMTPLLFLQSREKGVILLEVYRNVGQYSVDWTGFFPMMVLGVAPLLIFYLFMQKYIIKGVTAGSIKG